MPTFVLPVFNITASIWREASNLGDPPDLTADAQLYINTRGLLDIEPERDELWQPPVWLRVPVGTDLRQKDHVEVPPASGWFYHVRWVDRIHLGFPNEYLAGVLEQFLTPLGGGPPGGGPAGDAALMDGGGFILLDGGGFVLLD